MTGRPENKLETHFEKQGALPPPRLVGRVVRMAIGLWLLFFLYQLIVSGADIFIDRTPPIQWTVWLSAALGIALTPYVINIGFSRNWRQWPRVWVIVIALILIVVDVAAYGAWWAPPLGVFVLAWFIYWTGHLGISFVLSAIIATPGCEMRALPHLWTVVTRRRTHEHYCPGFLDNVDRWERTR